MFAYPTNFVPADKDPSNLPITHTYEPRVGMSGWGHAPPPVSYSHMPMMPSPPMMPFCEAAGCGGGQMQMGHMCPPLPAMPGAYPQQMLCQQCCAHIIPNTDPYLYSAPPMNGMSMYPHMAGAPTGYAMPAGIVPMEGGHPGGNVFLNPVTGESVWCGRTAEEVAVDDLTGSHATGANKPDAPIMPQNPAEDDSFWVIELDGSRSLRTYMSIELSCQPGRWHRDYHGLVYFVRHQNAMGETGN